ncbi:hypothetical protein T190607A02C_10149 [Tenacibaculum sp. 190524A02b]
MERSFFIRLIFTNYILFKYSTHKNTYNRVEVQPRTTDLSSKKILTPYKKTSLKNNIIQN